jgi:hypothetical protein
MIPMEGLLYLIPLALMSYFFVTLCARCNRKGSGRNHGRNLEPVIEPETLIQVSYQPASASNGHLNININGDPSSSSPINIRRYPQSIEAPAQSTYSEPTEVVRSVQINAVESHPPSTESLRRDIDFIDGVSISLSNEGSDDGEPTVDARAEISYNKISVREPLARVLAERAVMEHTYTEVDGDEGLSSFYEEIAGSATSSITYTKIGEVSVVGPSSVPQHASREDVIVVDVPGPSSSSIHLNPSPISSRRNRSESIPTPPPPPSVESLLVVAKTSCSSRSASPQQSIHSNHEIHPLGHNHNHNHFVHADETYALIDKSAKNRPPLNEQSSGDSDTMDTDALYARVEKTGHHHPSPNMNGLRSSMKDRPPPLPATPPPPPPVPSLKNLLRGPRAVSLIQSSAEQSAYRSHQRRFSSESMELPSNPLMTAFNSSKENRAQNSTNVQNANVIEDPGYEVVRNDDYELEPGYEEIGRRQDNEQDSANGHIYETSHTYDRPDGVYSDGSIADPGYEVVNHYQDSEADPGYEIITKRKAPSAHSFTPDPEYEVIKRSPQPLPPAPVVSRQESDVSADPGYERVRFVPRQKQPLPTQGRGQYLNGGDHASTSMATSLEISKEHSSLQVVDHAYTPLLRKSRIRQEFYERL